MPTFRSLRNPNFKLSSMRLAGTIVFVDSVYSTDDPAEVKVLRRHVKAGSLVEEFGGAFHEGGTVPSGEPPAVALSARETVEPTSSVADIVRPLAASIAAATEAQTAATEARHEAIDSTNETLNALAEPNDSWSNRALREHAADLGIKVPERAGKKALLDAIRIAEADTGDDFDPNDPDGS